MAKIHKRYHVNQCAIYKLSSKKRLSAILGITYESLKSIINCQLEYKEFSIKESYNYFSQKKIKSRQVQEPFGDLKKIHQRILYLIEPISVPDYVHAAVKKRSYHTNASSHKNSKVVATFDLKNFYSSTKSHLVYFFFLDTLKCPPDIAGVLTKLTTFNNSLPTGSSLSPLLSLHAAKPMLEDLNKLASFHNLIFTCYIDDLTFSGDSIPCSLERHIKKIVKLHGYNLATNKTKIFKADAAKHITGIVIHNGNLSVPYSRFRAVRKLDGAISGKLPSYGFSNIKLHEKLAGLLGETASIDCSYKHLAKNAQKKLKDAKNSLL